MMLDFGPETCEKIVVFLSKVEQCGYSPVQARALLFFLVLKNVTLAYGCTMVGVLESATDSRMEEKKHGEVGCYRRMPWRSRKNDVEKYNHNVEETDQGAVALVVDLAKAFQEVQFRVEWAWCMHIVFPQRVLRALFGHFQHQRGLAL